MAHRVTATVKFTGEPSPWQDDDKQPMNGYRVTLRYQGRRMTVPFWTGIGWTHEPSAADVLDCLASDAGSAQLSFEDWCEELGYDSDSRKAERTYNATLKQTEALRRLMGDDFDALVFGNDIEQDVRRFTEDNA